jgi:hypothetical protein
VLNMHLSNSKPTCILISPELILCQILYVYIYIKLKLNPDFTKEKITSASKDTTCFKGLFNKLFHLKPKGIIIFFFKDYKRTVLYYFQYLFSFLITSLFCNSLLLDIGMSDYVESFKTHIQSLNICHM